MSFIPEDRLGMGLAPSFSITDNMMLKTYADKEDIPAPDKTFKSVVKYALKKRRRRCSWTGKPQE